MNLAQAKTIILRIFSEYDLICLCAKSQNKFFAHIIATLTNSISKYFPLKFWTLFDLRELKISNSSQNWARSANLHFIILEILNAMDRHIEHCSPSFRQLNTFSVPTFTFAKCLNSYHPLLYVFSNHPNCGKQSHTVCIWILCEF